MGANGGRWNMNVTESRDSMQTSKKKYEWLNALEISGCIIMFLKNVLRYILEENGTLLIYLT